VAELLLVRCSHHARSTGHVRGLCSGHLSWISDILHRELRFIVSYGMMGQLHRALRERHPEVYDSLGQPTLFWNNSMKNSFAFWASSLAVVLGRLTMQKSFGFAALFELSTTLIWHSSSQSWWRALSFPRDECFSPITSNQSLEPTADRRETLLAMTSTLKLEAQLALVSGGSAPSR
jgi:hypothetical protein